MKTGHVRILNQLNITFQQQRPFLICPGILQSFFWLCPTQAREFQAILECRATDDGSLNGCFNA